MSLELILKKKKTLINILIIFFVISLALGFLNGIKYGSVSKVLVIQKSIAGTDVYTLNRSNEYLSGVLSSVVVSDSFFEEVMNAGFNIDKDYFTEEKNIKDQLEKWQKTVAAKPLLESGIIEVSVFHPDKFQAEQIARAVNFVLITKNENYLSSGGNVIIKVIDKPVVSDWPVKPNLPMNLSLGLLFGLVIGLTYIYLFPEGRYDLRIFPGRRKGKKYETGLGAGTQKDNWHSVSTVLKEKTAYKDTLERPAFSENLRPAYSEETRPISNTVSNNEPVQAKSEDVRPGQRGFEEILSKGKMDNLR